MRKILAAVSLALAVSACGGPAAPTSDGDWMGKSRAEVLDIEGQPARDALYQSDANGAGEFLYCCPSKPDCARAVQNGETPESVGWRLYVQFDARGLVDLAQTYACQ
jgi:hypothetical protein